MQLTGTTYSSTLNNRSQIMEHFISELQEVL